MRKTTHFKLFRNTPFTNITKYIHFKNNQERDEFFDRGFYSSINYSQPFNMVRDRLEVLFPMPFDEFQGLNYCYFTQDDSNVRYYCYISRTEYINDKVTKLYLMVDVLTTFFQGDWWKNIGTVYITRQHLTKASYHNQQKRLADRDYIACSNPRVIKQFYLPLNTQEYDIKDEYVQPVSSIEGLYVIFQASANLEKDFGSVDKPKLPVSKGMTYDGVQGVTTLYAVSYENADECFNKLSDYPWIAQTLSHINIIPEKFFDKNDLVDVDGKLSGTLKRFKNKAKSKLSDIETNRINFTIEQLNTIFNAHAKFNLTEELPHLLNSNYFNIFCTNQQNVLQLKAQNLPEDGLNWDIKGILGYENRFSFYPQKYNSENENTNSPFEIDGKPLRLPIPRGEFSNVSLNFEEFDEMPVYINNYNMSLANNAYKRASHDEYRLDNQAKSLVAKDTSDNKRLYNAMSVMSNLSPTAMQQNFRSEYEYYRDLRVEQEQAKIANPTITSQTTKNAYLIRNNFYGISVKMYAVSAQDLLNAYRYHMTTGFDCGYYGNIEDITSMSHLNYLQFSGDWVMSDIPSEFMTLAKELFAQGVSIYHTKDQANPFAIDTIFNQKIK